MQDGKSGHNEWTSGAPRCVRPLQAQTKRARAVTNHKHLSRSLRAAPAGEPLGPLARRGELVQVRGVHDARQVLRAVRAHRALDRGARVRLRARGARARGGGAAGPAPSRVVSGACHRGAGEPGRRGGGAGRGGEGRTPMADRSRSSTVATPLVSSRFPVAGPTCFGVRGEAGPWGEG